MLVDHREQVPGGLFAIRAGGAGAADGLTVDGQCAAPAGRGEQGALVLDERGQRGVESVGVDVLHDPADRGLARAALRGAEVLGHRAGRSATHSAIATNERAPAATAHTAVVSTTTRPWRTPRGLRGS